METGEKNQLAFVAECLDFHMRGQIISRALLLHWEQWKSLFPSFQVHTGAFKLQIKAILFLFISFLSRVWLWTVLFCCCCCSILSCFSAHFVFYCVSMKKKIGKTFACNEYVVGSIQLVWHAVSDNDIGRRIIDSKVCVCVSGTTLKLLVLQSLACSFALTLILSDISLIHIRVYSHQPVCNPMLSPLLRWIRFGFCTIAFSKMFAMRSQSRFWLFLCPCKKRTFCLFLICILVAGIDNVCFWERKCQCNDFKSSLKTKTEGNVENHLKTNKDGARERERKDVSDAKPSSKTIQRYLKLMHVNIVWHGVVWCVWWVSLQKRPIISVAAATTIATAAVHGH